MAARPSERRPVVHTRYGWYLHYADRFNKTGHPDAAIMACWYLTLHLAFGEESLRSKP